MVRRGAHSDVGEGAGVGEEQEIHLEGRWARWNRGEQEGRIAAKVPGSTRMDGGDGPGKRGVQGGHEHPVEGEDSAQLDGVRETSVHIVQAVGQGRVKTEGGKCRESCYTETHM